MAVIVQFTLFLILGIGLWAFYQGRAFPTPDAIFPTFIVDQMPHGLEAPAQVLEQRQPTLARKTTPMSGQAARHEGHDHQRLARFGGRGRHCVDQLLVCGPAVRAHAEH